MFDIRWLKRYHPDVLDLTHYKDIGRDAPRFVPGGPRPMPLGRLGVLPNNQTRVEFGLTLLDLFLKQQRSLVSMWHEILKTRELPGGLIYADNLSLPPTTYRILRHGQEVARGELSPLTQGASVFTPIYEKLLEFTEPKMSE